jgi:hypothetical protein
VARIPYRTTSARLYPDDESAARGIQCYDINARGTGEMSSRGDEGKSSLARILGGT